MRYKQYIENNCLRPDMPPSEVLAQAFSADDRMVAVVVEHTRFAQAQLHLGLAGEYGLLQSQILHRLVKLGCYEIRVDVSDPDQFGALSKNHPTTPQIPGDFFEHTLGSQTRPDDH